jgi:hypothetical protein
MDYFSSIFSEAESPSSNPAIIKPVRHEPRTQAGGACDCQSTHGGAFRDIFRQKMQIASKGLPVSLAELEIWFANDVGAIAQEVYPAATLREAVKNYVLYDLNRTPDPPPEHPKEYGQCRCVDCFHWMNTWCRNAEINGLYGTRKNAERWRRCTGYAEKTPLTDNFSPFF